VVTDESTELSDLGSGSDQIGKGDASMDESEGGMGKDSDDELNQAMLTEKEAKQVLHDEVIFLYNHFFFQHTHLHISYPKMFPLSSTTTLM
jgi:hypothetical protein